MIWGNYEGLDAISECIGYRSHHTNQGNKLACLYFCFYLFSLCERETVDDFLLH